MNEHHFPELEDGDTLNALVLDILVARNRGAARRCWGWILSGTACKSDFEAGEGHFKNKFCPHCRTTGVTISASRVCAVSPGSALGRSLSNKSGRTPWTNGARVVNQTVKCKGDWLIIFENDVPQDISKEAAVIPDEWLLRDAQGTHVVFSVRNGTLVPAVQSFGSKSRCSRLAEVVSAEASGPGSKRQRDYNTDLDVEYTSDGCLALDLTEQLDAPYSMAAFEATKVTASRADVAKISAIVSDERFKKTQAEHARICATSMSVLDEPALSGMYRMFCDSAIRSLTAAIGDEGELRRVLETFQKGGDLPCDDLSACEAAELFTCCSCLTDMDAWMAMVSSAFELDELAAQPAQSVTFMSKRQMLGLREPELQRGPRETPLLSPPQQLQQHDPDARIADAFAMLNLGGVADAIPDQNAKECVQRILRRINGALDDSKGWRAIHTRKHGGVKLLSKIADGVMWCTIQCELGGVEADASALTHGRLSTVALQAIRKSYEDYGYQVKHIFSENDQVARLGSASQRKMGVIERAFRKVLDFQDSHRRMFNEMMKDGAKVVELEWDMNTGAPMYHASPIYSDALSTPLPGSAVSTLCYDRSTRNWQFKGYKSLCVFPLGPACYHSLIDLLVSACGSMLDRYIESLTQAIHDAVLMAFNDNDLSCQQCTLIDLA